MKKRIMKRAGGMIMAAALCLSAFPAAAYADEILPDDGTQEIADEYSIRPEDAFSFEEEMPEETAFSENEGDAEASAVSENEEAPAAVLLDSAGEIDEIFKNVGDAIYADFSANGKYGYEWHAMELARAGYPINAAYLNSLKQTVKEKKGVLHTSKYNYTEYAKAVLVLTACGVSPSDVEGYDLLEMLADYDAITEQGVNGVIYALLALDSHNYEIPAAEGEKTQATRDNLIQAILDARLDDGGWDYAKKKADPDLTGMALQALAPYYHSEEYPKVTKVIDEVLELISVSMQTQEGYFCSPDAAGAPTSESSAQIILALTALGIDPDEDERFIKNGRSALDGLCDFWVDGGFAHTLSGSKNGLATVQGYYALVSALRQRDGKTSFYDMNDVEWKTHYLCSAEIAFDSTPYTGNPIVPACEVYGLNSAGKKDLLTLDSDYSVSCRNNQNAGTASILFSGIGDYNGSFLMRTFTIEPVSIKSAVLSDTAFSYTGSAIKPAAAVKAKVNGKTRTLKNGTDYKLTYKSNKKVGTAAATVTGTGNYTGSITKNFKINPTSIRFSSVKAGTKQLTLKWKKKKPEATGYQYQVSTKKTFGSAIVKSAKVKIADESAATITKTLRALKSGKTYYARIRAYTVTGGKTYYSDWSPVRTIAVK